MNDRSELLLSLREIFGTDEEDGYNLYISDNKKVPNYINKDGAVVFPEIRISPFLEDTFVTKSEKQIDTYVKCVSKIYKAVFNINIFSTSVEELHLIYNKLQKRIDKFINPYFMTYGFDPEKTQNLTDYYFNPEYSSSTIIKSIEISNTSIDKVDSLDSLVNNSWFLNDDGLYIKTDLNIKDVLICCAVDAYLFSDGSSAFEKGIFGYNILSFVEFSELEKNEVERILFKIEISYVINERIKLGPVIDEVSIGLDNYG